VNSYLDGEAYLEDAAAAAEGRSPPVRRLKTRDGERVFSLRTLSYRTLSGALEGATLVFTDVTEALELESALARERERLELAIRLARIGVFEYRVARVEAADIGSLEDSLQRAVAGEADYDVTFRMRGPDGATRCLRGLGRLLAGTTTPRLIGVTYDITAEWSQAEHRELMIREMNHRVKNLFAILSSIIANEAKTAVDPKTLAHSVQGRIAALGRAHSLAAGGGEARAIGMRELVATVLTPFAVGADARIGDDAFELSLRELTPMALILHEMATNSSKYGVLGDGSGSLCVSWRGDVGDGALIWEERFHAERPAALPIKPGFGTTLMDVSARQMGGAMERKRHPDGYVAIVRFKGGAGYGQSSAAG
jgi:two-component system CheB/CheR fusion protein